MTDADDILHDLLTVQRERERRAGDAPLQRRVRLLKSYQQARFRRTYDDLLLSPRYQPAARFFLEELYGPADFARRDADFARIVPAIVRLFSGDIVGTVRMMAALHALSERLDTRMAEWLPEDEIDPAAYARAWHLAGSPDERERQIEMVVSLGRQMDQLTRKRVLRHGLRLMRGPARAAGLQALQATLESGFEAFTTMQGAEGFLETIGERERRLAAALFSRAPDAPPPAELPVAMR